MHGQRIIQLGAEPGKYFFSATCRVQLASRISVLYNGAVPRAGPDGLRWILTKSSSGARLMPVLVHHTTVRIWTTRGFRWMVWTSTFVFAYAVLPFPAQHDPARPTRRIRSYPMAVERSARPNFGSKRHPFFQPTNLPLQFTPGSLDLNPGTTPAAWPTVKFWKEGLVTTLVGLPDGSLVVGGTFAALNNVSRQNLARLTPSGVVDVRWAPQMDGPVSILAAYGPDLFVAGGFQTVNGLPRAGLAKIHLSDPGTVDTDWDPMAEGSPGGQLGMIGTPFAGPVSSMVVADGHLFVGGFFNSIGGLPRTGLAKLDLTTGRADPEWAPVLSRADALVPVVWTLRPWQGCLLVGGAFSRLGGQKRSGLAKVQLTGLGEVDPDWDPVLDRLYGIETVRALEVDGDELLVGGSTASNSIVARLSLLSPGSAETNSIFRLESQLVALALVGNSLYVALQPHPDAPGHLLKKLSRVAPEVPVAEWQDPEFARPGYLTDIGQPLHALAEIYTLTVQGNLLWVGGSFRHVNNTRALGLVGLDPGSGQPGLFVQPQVQRPGTVLALEQQPDGKLIVGGEFALVDQSPRDNLARLRPDGTLDPAWFPETDGAVAALAVNATGIYVGGTFRQAGGLTCPHLAKFNLVGGDRPDPGWIPRIAPIGDNESRVCNPVTCLAIHEANLFVAGPFKILGGGFGGFAVVDTTTGSIGPGPFHPSDPTPKVQAMVLGPEDSLIVAGDFRSIAGLARPGLARVNVVSPFTVDPDWVPSLDWVTSGWPVSLAGMGPDLYVATAQGRVYRLDSIGAGEVDRDWAVPDWFLGPEAPAIRTLAVAGPDLYVGGLFWPLSAVEIPGETSDPTTLVQLDRETGTPKAAWNTGKPIGSVEDSSVHVLLGVGDDCYVGGQFEQFGGLPRLGLAFLANLDAPVLQEGAGWSYTVTRNPEDGPEVTHFRIIYVTGGNLYLHDGRTPVREGEFITVAQGQAGLVFVPEAGNTNPPSITAAAALNDSIAGTSSLTTTLTFLGGSGVPYFKFSQPNYQVRENETLRIGVEKIGAGAGSVSYATRDGTALAGDDYLARTGTLEFANWETTAVLPPIYTGNDFVFRGDRTFTVHLSASTGGGGLTEPANATVTIIDDDLLGAPDSCLQFDWPSPLLPRTNAALQVVLLPPGAGGQWRLAGELAWRNNEDVATGLAPDNYLVEFRSWPGYWPLSPRLFPAAEGQTNRLAVEYFAQPNAGRGHLTVRLVPESVGTSSDQALRGGWRLPGQTNWQDSGATVLDVPAGVYALEFKPLPNYLTPLDPEVIVFANQTAAATKTYLLAPQGTGAAPEPLSFDEVVSTNWPYLHNGQIASEFGFGSGVVVKERVVLTAAHVLFDDVNLRYAREVKWLHQKHRGSYLPAPQIPRGWYVFEGYAKQREIENSPGIQSLEAAKLDAAAMYFVGTTLASSTPGRGGYAGFLASDTALQNQHLLSGNLMILVGYPVTGVPPDQVGQMHATPPARLNFTLIQNNLFTTKDAHAFPGMSGGAVFVQIQDGRFCPAGVYLGSAYQPIVRTVDGEIAGLIGRAETSADEGLLDVGNGVTFVCPIVTDGVVATGQLSVVIGPRTAVDCGAAWRIPQKGISEYSSDPTKIIPLSVSGPFRIEFRDIAGYELPTNDVVEVAADQLSIIHAWYAVVRPVLRFDPTAGLTVFGTDNTRYQIEIADRVDGRIDWAPFAIITLTNGSIVVPGTDLSNRFRAFYRAVWLPEP
jgi:hypothetical protein